MQNVLFILLIIFLTFSFNYICRSYSIFLDNRESSKHKNFIPSNKVPLTGGVIFFFGILFLSHNNFNLNIKIFGALLLIIGLLSDTLFMKSWFSRIFLQLIILVFYVFISNNIVLETRVVILDSFLKNYYFRIFFLCFLLFSFNKRN